MKHYCSSSSHAFHTHANINIEKQPIHDAFSIYFIPASTTCQTLTQKICTLTEVYILCLSSLCDKNDQINPRKSLKIKPTFPAYF